jgi:hypothetical protein
MMKKTLVAFALLPLLALAPATAQDPAIDADATTLMCDLGEVVDCDADGKCSSGSPESVDLPRFLRIDMDAGELSSPSPGFEGETTPAAAIERADGSITVFGKGRAGRTFLMSVSEQTGLLKGSVLADDFAFLVFGGCVKLGH